MGCIAARSPAPFQMSVPSGYDRTGNRPVVGIHVAGANSRTSRAPSGLPRFVAQEGEENGLMYSACGLLAQIADIETLAAGTQCIRPPLGVRRCSPQRGFSQRRTWRRSRGRGCPSTPDCAAIRPPAHRRLAHSASAFSAQGFRPRTGGPSEKGPRKRPRARGASIQRRVSPQQISATRFGNCPRNALWPELSRIHRTRPGNARRIKRLLAVSLQDVFFAEGSRRRPTGKGHASAESEPLTACPVSSRPVIVPSRHDPGRTLLLKAILIDRSIRGTSHTKRAASANRA